MAMHLRKLQLRITTMRGLFGVDLDFDEVGLNVIRAHNTSGKSTCVQALVYCLGLEAMLTTNRSAPPLQYALLQKFQFGEEEEVAVDESEVLVEVADGHGRVIAVRRPIVSHTEGTNLIQVWAGPHLTDPLTDFPKESYFVRLEGAAQRERGFHKFLADFLHWDLPLVPKFDGSEVPLYLECLFPLFIVEQKHGWSGIQSRMPTHFGIREMAKRATEFTMRLDSYTIAAERQRLKESLSLLERRWEQSVSDLSGKLGVLGGLARRVPKMPITHWPPTPEVECLVFDGKEWLTIVAAKLAADDSLSKLDAETVVTADEDAGRNAEKLKAVQRELSTLEVFSLSVSRDVETEAAQIDSLDRRIEALGVDLQNYQDVRRLRQIGASVALSVSNGRCPTCDQSIDDALLPQTGATAPMSLDENIDFIGGQIRAFASMRRDSERVLDSKKRSLQGIRAKMQELRSSIRAYKLALTSSGRDASAGMVRERMVAEDNLQKYKLMSTVMDEAMLLLEALSAEYKVVYERLEALPGATSPEDEGKLLELDKSFISQLEEYGFSSVRPSLLSISRESYRPTYEGFDLGFNLSASDMIRTIWSYLYGLLEVSRLAQTNHPGILILDEPRQQQANRMSFAVFAQRAAASRQANQQVIFLTSEDEDSVQEMLAPVSHRYINFAGRTKLIQPLAPTVRT